MWQPIDETSFMQVTRPLLQNGDAAALAHAVNVRWRPSEIIGLLKSNNTDVRRVAALTLGMVGNLRCVPALTRALRDDDEQVNEMAEHGLWSIWFRSCNDAAAEPFRNGVEALEEERLEDASLYFEQAVELDPEFAEGYDQLANVQYLQGMWEVSLSNYCQATARMPLHFGAIAGMGHVYTQLGLFPKAIQAYRHALRLNPTMDAVREAIDELQPVVGAYESTTPMMLGRALG